VAAAEGDPPSHTKDPAGATQGAAQSWLGDTFPRTAALLGASEEPVSEVAAKWLAAEPNQTLVRAVPPAKLAEMAAAFPNTPLADLARFLVACKHDVQKATARYVNHLDWRCARLGSYR
jgi:hypothetical protein